MLTVEKRLKTSLSHCCLKIRWKHFSVLLLLIIYLFVEFNLFYSDSPILPLGLAHVPSAGIRTKNIVDIWRCSAHNWFAIIVGTVDVYYVIHKARRLNETFSRCDFLPEKMLIYSDTNH